MMYQTTEGIDERLHLEGCYFFSVLRIFEVLTGYALSVKEVNMIFRQALEVGFIGHEKYGPCYMKERAVSRVLRIASALTHYHVSGRRVELEKDSNFKIGKYVRRTSGGKAVSHFVLMDGLYNTFYDPWSEEGSRTVREGVFHSPRYIFAELT